MPLSYYIYYRVQPQQEGAAQRCVSLLQSRLREQTGIVGRFLVKRDEPWLWMELYHPVVDATAFESALLQAVADSGLGEYLAPGSSRRCECFREASVCA